MVAVGRSPGSLLYEKRRCRLGKPLDLQNAVRLAEREAAHPIVALVEHETDGARIFEREAAVDVGIEILPALAWDIEHDVALTASLQRSPSCLGQNQPQVSLLVNIRCV